jgi:dUTPase
MPIEKTKKPKVKVKGKMTPVVNKSLAAEYSVPNILNIATNISVEEDIFVPVYKDSNMADVRVVVPALNHQGVQAVRLNHRTVQVLDCGFNIKVPEGFRVKAEAKKAWANRGLFVSHCYVENDRLKLMITNIGQETPLVVSHKESIAQIWLEPIYFFEFNKSALPLHC